MTPKSKTEARRAIGVWLRCKRKAAGLSLAQVADLIGHPEAFVAHLLQHGRAPTTK